MERKYQMTRMGAGDYLLPSNDGQTLWRIYRYEEYGSLSYAKPGGGYTEVRGWFWACARRPMPKEWLSFEELRDWSDIEWEFYSGPLSSRREAIEETLGAERIAATREP